MKKLGMLFVAVMLTLAAPAALATCPTPPTYHNDFVSWYDYSPANSCVSASSATSVTMTSCYNLAGWSIGSAQAVISYQFTASEPNLQYWDAEARLEFNDPTNSTSNWVKMWAYVTHNSVTTATLIFAFDGADGDLSCQYRAGGFTALTGDTVKIVINGRKASSNATIQVSNPSIWAYDF